MTLLERIELALYSEHVLVLQTHQIYKEIRYRLTSYLLRAVVVQLQQVLQLRKIWARLGDKGA